MNSSDSAPEGGYVEFVHRVHTDGREERFARVISLDAEGRPVLGPRRPTGALREFVLEAVRRHTALRRVAIASPPPGPRRP